MGKVFKLEKWATVFLPNKFTKYIAPELLPMRICGKVYGNDKFENGEEIITSPVEKFDKKNKLAITRSGSLYYLGEPAKEFIEWCEENNMSNLLDEIMGIKN